MGSDLQDVRCAIGSTSSTFLACLWFFPSLHLQQSIQLLLLPRPIILILDRRTLGGTVSTRTPTATWLRRWYSRTSASPTQRGLATPRTRNPVQPRPSRTAPVLLKPKSSESVST